ncbi:hypothetical protein CO130_02520 [Candidatus Jorgensenbacteria bacterium CG_4_9_14_3_um_filter_38_10]|nr:MAG: hypothetical protein CO130_02520 [Candidatus Jorgensenbacteria bacterium CG_4_9_14_3_um_filter_38_10]
MKKQFAEELAKSLKISVNQVVREYWEMVILREISQSRLADFLIFAGGTALRLAYNSPRFSDDLDFYLKKRLPFSVFRSAVSVIAKKYNLEITDLYSKYFTFLAEFKIKEDYLIQPFRIKIEVRGKIFKKDTELRLLNSATGNFQVLITVLTLPKIQELKINALKQRKEPRDLFDLWFIAQQLKIPFKKPAVKIDKKTLKQNLSKYLPFNFQKVIDNLTK